MISHLLSELESSIEAAFNRGHFALFDAAMAKAASTLAQQLEQGHVATPPALNEDAVMAVKPSCDEILELAADMWAMDNKYFNRLDCRPAQPGRGIASLDVLCWPRS